MMTNHLRKLLIAVCCAVMVVSGTLVCFSVKADGPVSGGITVTNAQILSGINGNAEKRSFIVSDGENEYAEITAGYGTIGNNEQSFNDYNETAFTGDNWTWISAATSGDYCWHGNSGTYGKDVFLKVAVKKDCYLSLAHPDTGEKASDDNTMKVEVIRVRGEKSSTLSSVAVKNGQNNVANSLLKDAGNVKAGDVVYVALRGQWETKLYFNPEFTFSDTKVIPLNVEKTNATILSEINADSADRKSTVYDVDGELVAEITAGYGTIGSNEQSFNDYNETAFTGDNWTWISAATSGDYCWHGNSKTYGKDVFLKITVKKDCYLSLAHPDTGEKASDDNTMKVEVIRVHNGKTATLSSVAVKNGQNNVANSLLKDAGNVKAGDTVYIALRGQWEPSLYFNPVLTFRDKEKVALGGVYGLNNLIESVLGSEDRVGEIYDSDDRNLFSATALYGEIDKDEKQFSSFDVDLKTIKTDNEKGPQFDQEAWKSQNGTASFIKLEIKQDGVIKFYNPEGFTGGLYFSWSNFSITKVTNHLIKRLYVSDRLNPNGEEKQPPIYGEGEYIDYETAVKSGDVIYLAVYGDNAEDVKYGYQMPLDFLTIDFGESRPVERAVESANIGLMVYNVAQAKGAYVTNESLTAYTLTTGVAERAKAFEKFEDNLLSYPSAGEATAYVDAAGNVLVNAQLGIALRVQILNDCDFRFTHPVIKRGTWAAGYTRVRVCKRSEDNGIEELRSTPVTALELPENYYCPDTYQAKQGEEYIMIFETTNTYYAGTLLPLGYEAGTLEVLPESEKITSASVAAKPQGQQLYGINVYEVSGESYTEMSYADGTFSSASGSALTATDVTAAAGKKVALRITAKRNIRLDLNKTSGVSAIKLASGETVKNNANLAAGDYVDLIFSESGAFEVDLTADKSRYTAAARIDGAKTESYDLYDMMNQLAFGGDSNNYNQRKLSTFTLTSGKLYGAQQTLICTDYETAHFVNPDGSQNTGVKPQFFNDGNGFMGTYVYADNGYDTIITVTAKYDSKITLGNTVMNDEQWALSTYIKALAVDADGTAVVLFDRPMTKTYEKDAFGTTVNLKAGQSIAVVYYTSTTLYGAAHYLPVFTVDTESYDETAVVDFSAARELRVYKEEKTAELESYYNTLGENDYNAANWLEIQKIFETGKEKIMDAASKEEADASFAGYKGAIQAVKTTAQEKAELDAVKNQKIAELDEFFATLKKSDYSSDNWSKLTQIYENGKKSIANQPNATKVNNSFQSAKTAMKAVEKGGSTEKTGCSISMTGSGAWLLIALTVGLAALIKRKVRG